MQGQFGSYSLPKYPPESIDISNSFNHSALQDEFHKKLDTFNRNVKNHTQGSVQYLDTLASQIIYSF
jgi:hypothetical protein